MASPRVVAAGDWTTGARGVAIDGTVGRVWVGAVRPVSGARGATAGDWTTGARGVAIDGTVGRVTTGAVRVWDGWGVGVVLGVLAGRD